MEEKILRFAICDGLNRGLDGDRICILYVYRENWRYEFSFFVLLFLYDTFLQQIFIFICQKQFPLEENFISIVCGSGVVCYQKILKISQKLILKSSYQWYNLSIR